MKWNGNLSILVSDPRDPSHHLLCPISTRLRSELVLGNPRDGALHLEGGLKGSCLFFWGPCDGVCPAEDGQDRGGPLGAGMSGRLHS